MLDIPHSPSRTAVSVAIHPSLPHPLSDPNQPNPPHYATLPTHYDPPHASLCLAPLTHHLPQTAALRQPAAAAYDGHTLAIDHTSRGHRIQY